MDYNRRLHSVRSCSYEIVIRAVKGARNRLIELEDLSDEDLKNLEKQFQRVRKKAEWDGSNTGHIKPNEPR